MLFLIGYVAIFCLLARVGILVEVCQSAKEMREVFGCMILQRNKHEPEVEEAALVSCLQAHNIPFLTWGTGESKRVLDLLSEVNEGESVLREENGELVRHLSVAAVHVYYRDGTRV